MQCVITLSLSLLSCNATNNNTSLMQCVKRNVCVVLLLYVNLNMIIRPILYFIIISIVPLLDTQVRLTGWIDLHPYANIRFPVLYHETRVFLALLYWLQLGFLSADRSILVCSLNFQPLRSCAKSKWGPNHTYTVSHSYVKSYWHISLLHNSVCL